jgi:hypothetical protein
VRYPTVPIALQLTSGFAIPDGQLWVFRNAERLGESVSCGHIPIKQQSRSRQSVLVDNPAILGPAGTVPCLLPDCAKFIRTKNVHQSRFVNTAAFSEIYSSVGYRVAQEHFHEQGVISSR